MIVWSGSLCVNGIKVRTHRITSARPSFRSASTSGVACRISAGSGGPDVARKERLMILFVGPRRSSRRTHQMTGKKTSALKRSVGRRVVTWLLFFVTPSLLFHFLSVQPDFSIREFAASWASPTMLNTTPTAPAWILACICLSIGSFRVGRPGLAIVLQLVGGLIWFTGSALTRMPV